MMAGMYGNLLVNGAAHGFKSPEEFAELLIKNKCLDEFLEMVEGVKKDLILEVVL